MVIDPQLGIKLVFILGIINIIGLFLVLTSCRCMGIASITNRFFQYPWYQKYYNKHCWYWWIFITSVILHAFFAFYTIGNPF